MNKRTPSQAPTQPEPMAQEASDSTKPAVKRRAPQRTKPFVLVPPDYMAEFEQWLKTKKLPRRLFQEPITIESQRAQIEFLEEKGISPLTAAAMRRASVGTRMSPEEYRAVMARKGWTYRDLSEEWQIGTTWLMKKIADPQRPKMWDHAVLGLPTHKK